MGTPPNWRRFPFWFLLKAEKGHQASRQSKTTCHLGLRRRRSRPVKWPATPIWDASTGLRDFSHGSIRCQRGDGGSWFGKRKRRGCPPSKNHGPMEAGDRRFLEGYFLFAEPLPASSMVAGKRAPVKAEEAGPDMREPVWL